MHLGVIVLGTGDYQIEWAGIYFISCSLIVDQKHAGLITAAININEEEILDSTLQSSSYEGIGETTIQVNGLFRTYTNGIVSIYLLSKGDGQIVKTSSQLSFTLLSKYGITQALSLRLKKDVYINSAQKLSWTSTNTFGGFISTNLFTISDGYFVAKRDGSYFVSCNFIFRNQNSADECLYELTVYTGNKDEFLTSSKISPSKQSITTINIAGTINLKKGNKIWPVVTTPCLQTFLVKKTTYSLSFLPSNTGFSVVSKTISSYIYESGWTLMHFSSFTDKFKGGYVNPAQTKKKYYLAFRYSSLLLITANILITTPLNSLSNITGLKLAITRNVIPKKNTERDVLGLPHLLTTLSGDSLSQATICISSLIEVRQNDNLRFSFYFPQQNKWILRKGSTVSAIVVRSYDNTRANTRTNMNGIASKWMHLSSCSSHNKDEIVETTNGIVKVSKSGIYYVTAHVTIFNYKLNIMDVALIYDHGQTKRSKTILYTKEMSINKTFTFQLASAIRINADQELGMYVQLPGVSSFQVNCDISVAYIGYIFGIIGFQANLNSNYNLKSSGYVSVRDYYDPSVSALSDQFHYNTGNRFSFHNGTFMVPATGIYMISANVVINDFNMMAKLSWVTVFISINDNLQTALASKRLRKLKLVSPDRFSTISFCLTAPIKLVRYDTVKLKIFSRLDYKWTINKLTSFSVVLISELTLSHGFLGYRSYNEFSRNGKWRSLYGWSTQNPVNGRFSGIAIDSPRVIDNKKIQIRKSGQYIISFHLLLQQTKPKYFAIGLIETKDDLNEINARACNEFNNPFQIMAIGCSILMHCEKGEQYYVKLSTAENIQVADFINRKYEHFAVTFISAILLNRPPSYQASFQTLKVSSAKVTHPTFI